MKTSMIYALAFRKHDKILRNYASEKFYESNYYKINSKLGHIWFNGYEVLDENTIEIKYQYGGGDMEMDDSFEVKIEE